MIVGKKGFKKSREKLPENSPYVPRLQKVQCQYLFGPENRGRAASFPGMNHQKSTYSGKSLLYICHFQRHISPVSGPELLHVAALHLLLPHCHPEVPLFGGDMTQ